MKITIGSLLATSLLQAQGFAPTTPLKNLYRDPHMCTTLLRMITTPSNVPIPSKRRKKLAFKHLFRHYDDISMDCWLRCLEPNEFLKSCGYTQGEINAMVEEMPTLIEQDVHDQLAPHVRFLVKTLQGGTGDLLWASAENDQNNQRDSPQEECEIRNDDAAEETDRHTLIVSKMAKKAVPTRFYNIRLEKSLAPWHAYLSWQEGLPSGRALLEEDGIKLGELLDVCEISEMNKFAELCNSWEVNPQKQHTLVDIQDFQNAFYDGLVPAVRSHLHSSTTCSAGHLVELLLSHGANHLEDDHHGASLLHWAAGTGNKRAVQALIRAGIEDGLPVNSVIASDHTSKDGATPLHWAAAGVSSQGVFGTGGHGNICRLLLDLAGSNLAEETTYTQNSPLEWAAWANSIDVVKLLVEDFMVDPHFCSENGNVAHWACAGGSLSICKYLADTCGVNFEIKNAAKGWTPLDLAKSEGHEDIVEWLEERIATSQTGDGNINDLDRCWDSLKTEVSCALKQQASCDKDAAEYVLQSRGQRQRPYGFQKHE